jgi:hypothetical protein
MMEMCIWICVQVKMMWGKRKKAREERREEEE